MTFWGGTLGVVLTIVALLVQAHFSEKTLDSEQVKNLRDKFFQICRQLEKNGMVVRMGSDDFDQECWSWCSVDALIPIGTSSLKFGLYYRAPQFGQPDLTMFEICLLPNRATEKEFKLHDLSRQFGLPRRDSISYFMEINPEGMVGFISYVAHELEIGWKAIDFSTLHVQQQVG